MKLNLNWKLLSNVITFIITLKTWMQNDFPKSHNHSNLSNLALELRQQRSHKLHRFNIPMVDILVSKQSTLKLEGNTAFWFISWTHLMQPIQKTASWISQLIYILQLILEGSIEILAWSWTPSDPIIIAHLCLKAFANYFFNKLIIHLFLSFNIQHKQVFLTVCIQPIPKR